MPWGRCGSLFLHRVTLHSLHLAGFPGAQGAEHDDYHPSFQEIAFLVEETGECDEGSLKHSNGEAEKFYRDLKARGISARVGMETTGYSRWFERLLAELGSKSGSAMRQRSRPDEPRKRRRIVRMQDFC